MSTLPTMGELILCRASAGAGKTHQLVLYYLQYALTAPGGIEKVIALTFTNKATKEMRDRIGEALQVLYQDGEQSYYYAPLQQMLGDKSDCMRNITTIWTTWCEEPHRIHITTIDAFLHSLYKPLMAFLDPLQERHLSLNSQEILKKSIHKLWEQPNVQGVLTTLLLQQIEREERPAINSILEHMAMESMKNSSALDQGKKWEIVWKEQQKWYRCYHQQLQKQAMSLYQWLQQRDYTASDFLWKEKGIWGFIEQLAKGKWIAPSTRIIKAGQSIEGWLSKKSQLMATFVPNYTAFLQPKLQILLAYQQRGSERYHSWKAIRKLYPMISLEKKFQQLLPKMSEQQGIFLAPLLLKQLLKITQQQRGIRWLSNVLSSKANYFLIDEFQDISRSQWHLLAPLVTLGLRSSCSSLLVGDVKQSIYKWRGGAPMLFLTEIPQQFQHFPIKERELPYNHRSSISIVAFNNQLFSSAKEIITKSLWKALEGLSTAKELSQQINKAYKGVHQELPSYKSALLGGVYLKYLPTTAEQHWKEKALEEIIAVVTELQQAGIVPEQIAFLVRNRSEASLLQKGLANYAAAHPSITHVSYATHFVAASSDQHPLWHWLIALFRCLLYPEQTTYYAAALIAYYNMMEIDSKVEEAIVDLDHVIERFKEIHFFFEDWKYIWKTTPSLSLLPAFWRLLKPLHHSLSYAAWMLFEASYEVFEQQSSELSGPAGFVAAYDQQLIHWVKQSIRPNMMPILTIHQAKGLAYEAVLIPFASWALDHLSGTRPIHWHTTLNCNLTALGSVPLYYNKSLLQTSYGQSYGEEKTAQYLEQLNLFYVACTRPRRYLYLWTVQNKNRGDKVRSIGDLLNSLTFFLVDGLKKNAVWKEQECLFTAGMPIQPILSQSRAISIRVPFMEPISPPTSSLALNADKPAIALSSTNFLQLPWEPPAPIWGPIWHQCLAELITSDQLPKLTLRWEQQKRAAPTLIFRWTEALKMLWDRYPNLASWFSKEWIIYRERTIWVNQRSFRLDRVMIKEKEAIVLDYKTGAPSEKDKQQVRQYIYLLKEMGYEKTSGYLLYFPQIKLPQGELYCVE